MRVAIAVVVLLLAGTVAPAAAGDDAGHDRKVALGGSLGVWFPTSDADDVADASPAFRPSLTYWLHPAFGMTGAFDYVVVNEDENIPDITYYVFSVGGRLTLPGTSQVKPYGEALVGWHFESSDLGDDDSIGFRFGGGVSYAFNAALLGSAGFSYSTTTLEFSGLGITVERDIAAWVLDLGIAARL